jgi:hypothetical protein
MGSKKSSSSSSTTTSMTDNSAVAGDSSIAMSAGSSYNQQIVGTDPGALQFAALAAELNGAVAESNSDGVRFMVSAGADMVGRMGESATKIYGQAGSNNTESWAATVGAAERVFESTAAKMSSAWADTVGTSAALLGDIAGRAGRTSDQAQALAAAAIQASQPIAKDEQQTMRTAMWAAAAVAALVIVPKLLK